MIAAICTTLEPLIQLILSQYPYQTLGVLALVAGWCQWMSARSMYKTYKRSN